MTICPLCVSFKTVILMALVVVDMIIHRRHRQMDEVAVIAILRLRVVVVVVLIMAQRFLLKM